MNNKHAIARDFFLHLFSTVVLFLSMISMLVVLFAVVDQYIADSLYAAYRYDSAREALRFGLSMLIIVFPLYAWSLWYMGKLVKAQPAIRELKVRKWLTYLTIFVAAMVIVITLITLLYSYFDGDLTLRVFLKIAATLIVAAGTLSYYLILAKDTEDKKIQLKRRIIEIKMLVLVALAIVVGLVAFGSPGDQRAIRFDDERSAHLRSMYYDIELFERRNDRLPNDLSEIKNTRLDPDSGEPYTYTIIGERVFQLCAIFDLDQPERPKEKSRPNYDILFIPDSENTFIHPAGEHCFEFDLDVSS